MKVRVQEADFSPGAEIDDLLARPGIGGIGSFLGVVRSDAGRPIKSLTLEHYPAMTQPALERIAQEAMARFGLLGCTVIHRYGSLLPGERIVLVATAASHRRPALDAAGFLIDWLKTKAPFWKQEVLANGETAWVAAREEDDAAAAGWAAVGPLE